MQVTSQDSCVLSARLNAVTSEHEATSESIVRLGQCNLSVGEAGLGHFHKFYYLENAIITQRRGRTVVLRAG